MSRNLDNKTSRKRSTTANLLLNICLVLNFMSIVTCGVSAIKINSDEDNLELPLNVLKQFQLNHFYNQIPNDDSFSLEQRSSRFYDEVPTIFVKSDGKFDDAIDMLDETPEEDVSAGGSRDVIKKDLIPRLYKKNGRDEMPRLYRRSGIPRLYKKSGIPRLYKKDGEDEKLTSYQIYRRDSMPRLYKKSGGIEDETVDEYAAHWLRPGRSGSIPRLYKKRSLGGIPRLYKKSNSMRVSRALTPRLYKKSSFMKKMLPRLYKRNANGFMPRLY